MFSSWIIDIDIIANIIQSQHFLPTDDPEHNLIVFETIHILPSAAEGKPESSHPTMTADIHSDYSFFVTHERGVFYLSMSSWIQKLERELSTAQNEGAEFRLNIFLEDARSVVEHTIRIPKERYENTSTNIASCVIIDDSDIGYFLLTAVHGEPYAANLDISADDVFLDPAVERHMALDMDDLPQRLELRQSYQPPQTFWMRSELASFIEQKVPARRRGSLKEEVKLSEATLNLLIKSHQILSQETHQLSLAAADLFRRCERLKDEFRDQIFRASQLATRIDGVTGDDEEDFNADEERIVGSAKIERRLEEVKLKQHYLVTQHERIRKKLAKIGGRELTEKEEAWVVELDIMDQSIDYGSQANNVNQENGGVPTWQRFDEVKRLKDDLMMQAKEAGTDTEDEGANGAVKVPSEFRKQRVGRVMELLERETALVDAAAQRLNRLNVQAL